MIAKIFKNWEELEDKVEYKEQIGRLIQDMQHLSTGDPEIEEEGKEREENSPRSKMMSFRMEISGTVMTKKTHMKTHHCRT